MPALLSHFGINTARYVTADGEIVFDGSTSGSVTQIADHSFHGGEDESDDGFEGSSAWWDDEVELNRNIEAMEKAFPRFVYVPADDGHGPCWLGEINTGRGRFRIGIFTRRDQGLPRVIPATRQLGIPAGRGWSQPPHLYLSGNLCVADKADWDPAEHTAATVTAWAAHWLAAYTEWRVTRKWPVEGVRSIVA